MLVSEVVNIDPCYIRAIKICQKKKRKNSTLSETKNYRFSNHFKNLNDDVHFFRQN